MTTNIVRARPAPARPELDLSARRELWPALASITLGLALLEGLGAFDNLYALGPTSYAAAMGVLLVVTILFSPRGLLRSVVFPRWLVLFVTWVVLSYGWSTYRGTFAKETMRDLITVAVVVVLGQFLPVDRFLRVVLNTGYAAIALIVFTALALHARAFDPTEGGLRGPFIHKSQMGSTLILMLAVALCIERRTWLRRVLTGTVVILLVVAKTTTGIASILLVLLLYAVLVRYQPMKKSLGRAFGVLMTGFLVIFGVSYVALSNALVAAAGKDLTFSNRTKIWSGVIEAVNRRPIVGYGWSVWSALWLQPASGVITAAGFAVAESHNAALELLLRLGLVGLVLYLGLLFTTLRTGLRLARVGDAAGIFAVLLVAIVVIWGVSEALPINGIWVGLLAVAAVPRPMPAAAVPKPRTVVRRRFFAPRSAGA